MMGKLCPTVQSLAKHSETASSYPEVPKTCKSAKNSRSIFFTITVFSNIYASKTQHNACFDLDTKCRHESTGEPRLFFSSSSSSSKR